MENPTPTLIVLIGSALRIGIPIFITFFVVLILRKLDARWKAEAEAAPAPELVVQKEPCWEILGCDSEAVKVCPAPASPEPCWQVRRQKNGYLQEKCLTCQVFLQAPLPTPTHTPIQA
jgi:hypothetical protein